MKQIFLLLVLLALAPSLAAQDTLWTASHGAPNRQRPTAIVESSSGAVFTVGWTDSTGGADVDTAFGGFDAWVTKHSASGQLLWANTYGGSGSDQAFDALAMDDGGLVLVGHTNSSGPPIGPNKGNFDGWILRLDSAGTIVWSQTYGGSIVERFLGLAREPDGTLIAVGTTGSIDGDVGFRFLTGQSAMAGWFTRIGPADGSLLETDFVVGTTNENFLDDIQDIVRLPNGHFITVGTSMHFQFLNSANIWITELDANGDTLRTDSLGSDAFDEGLNVFRTDAGNLLFAGNTQAPFGAINGDVLGSSGAGELWAIQVDSAWNTLWSQTFGSPDAELFADAARAGDTTFLLGFTRSSLAFRSDSLGGNDAWLVAVDAAGNQLFEASFGGSASDLGKALAVAANGDVLLAGEFESADGFAQGNAGGDDFWTARFRPRMVTSRKETSAGQADAPRLRMGPNPAREHVAIELAAGGSGNYRVLDLNGRQLRSGVIHGGRAALSLSGLPAGVYLVVADVPGGRLTRRLMVLPSR